MTERAERERWKAPQPIPDETYDSWLTRVVESLEDYVNGLTELHGEIGDG